jgi:hypothetical protein
VVPLAAADLPDALVGLLAPSTDHLTEPDQHPRRRPVQVTAPAHELEHRIHHLAVDIELELAGGAVADANGL